MCGSKNIEGIYNFTHVFDGRRNCNGCTASMSRLKRAGGPHLEMRFVTMQR